MRHGLMQWSEAELLRAAVRERQAQADKVREAPARPRDYPTDVFFLTRLYRHELAHIKNAFNDYDDRDERCAS